MQARTDEEREAVRRATFWPAFAHFRNLGATEADAEHDAGRLRILIVNPDAPGWQLPELAEELRTNPAHLPLLAHLAEHGITI